MPAVQHDIDLSREDRLALSYGQKAGLDWARVQQTSSGLKVVEITYIKDEFSNMAFGNGRWQSICETAGSDLNAR